MAGVHPALYTLVFRPPPSNSLTLLAGVFLLVDVQLAPAGRDAVLLQLANFSRAQVCKETLC